MEGRHGRRARIAWWLSSIVLAMVASCGGGDTGNERDSGAQKTYLRVEATDADGDALSYQWRVTAGSIENRNSPETVWTLPDGPGLHFAYVKISDGRGGYVQQQYAVSSDALKTPAPVRVQAPHAPPAPSDSAGLLLRLRFQAEEATDFAVVGGTPKRRTVYLTDVPVTVVPEGQTSPVLFSGTTDVSGELSLPKLAPGTYDVLCASAPSAPFQPCPKLGVGSTVAAQVVSVTPSFSAGLNLRLYGHIGFADGGVCGTGSEFFQQSSSATIQLLQPDGTALTAPRRVNRFGDYVLQAAVPVRASLRLRVACEGYSTTLDVPAAGAGGYLQTVPVELSHRIANSRPVISRMLANGGDGNVRGQTVVITSGIASNALPGEDRFLSYKGLDTRLGACRYYRSFGMVRDCDAQGNMIEPVTLESWQRVNELPPYPSAGRQASANYINKMDLNLVRRMTAAAKSRDSIAFLVCNHPGPDGESQAEVDEVLGGALAGERLVACVGMEWSRTPGVNGGLPFTKFVTFGPDGSLLASVNLDGRGEKYLPGTCVACHGGDAYNGRFPESGNPSPFLGSRFLPFDTGNYFFGSAQALTEVAQAKELRNLNNLVSDTESLQDGESTPTRRLVQGWYAGGTDLLNKAFVPDAWRDDLPNATPGSARLYREVIGTSCRTCHTAMTAPRYDWDSTLLTPDRAATHVCGGTPDLSSNASMPNALVTRDRVAEKTRTDPSLADLMRRILGCDSPLPDPAYPAR